jgi:hypothetical protein
METQSKDQTTGSDKRKTYVGGCHCGRVHFEATFDLSAGLGKCNCSICKKMNFLGAKVKPQDFKLLAGEEMLVDYLFNSKVVHHLFCKNCGVQAFGHANIPQAGGEYYTVNVHCLAGADTTGIPVKYYDGKNNNWWNDAPPFP